MALVLARPRLLTFAGNNITDHNRSPVSINPERIETKTRMANGVSRKYYIADKHTFSVSWDDLPTDDARTVDGYKSGAWMENFFLTTPGSFTLTMTEKSLTTNAYDLIKTYTVMFTAFEHSVKHRWKTHEFWSVSLSLEEV